MPPPDDATRLIFTATPPLLARRGGRGARSAPALLLALLLILTQLPPAHAQQPFAIPDVTLSGGSLRSPVSLAPTDADAFRRRINLPPRLEFVPQPTGPSFTVTTPYWNDAIDRKEGEERSEVDDVATYWPQGGYLRTQLGDAEVWTVLDLRQRAMLDRYIRLGSAGDISSRPGNLAVLSAASTTEFIGISAGIAPLTATQRTAFWSAFGEPAPVFLDPFEPPQPNQDGFWLLLNIPDGPGYEYYFDGATLTDSFGAERYTLTPALRSFLTGLTPAAPAIEHEDPPGGLYWWPIMGGGGLLAIGAAYYLNRRNQQRAPTKG